MNSPEIGKYIRERRKSLGLSQGEVAALASCSKPTVIAAEMGKPTLRLNVLISILGALGLLLKVESDK